jgi:hypothetical protein
MKYRAKTEVFEAVQWNKPGDHPAVFESSGQYVCMSKLGMSDLENLHIVRHGDWIVNDHRGGHVSIQRDKFASLYEPVCEGPWDASQIKQPGWDHVQQAFIDGAREARTNPDATDEDFGRASDGYTKRVFEEVDPVSEAALRTESWKAPSGVKGEGNG